MCSVSLDHLKVTVTGLMMSFILPNETETRLHLLKCHYHTGSLSHQSKCKINISVVCSASDVNDP